jgi:hypothetical protein
MARTQIKTVKRTQKGRPGKKAPLDELVAKLVGNCVKALEKKDLKVTIADLFRLRELQKEWAPKELVRSEVTWLDGGMEAGRD